eukprot:403370027
MELSDEIQQIQRQEVNSSKNLNKKALKLGQSLDDYNLLSGTTQDRSSKQRREPVQKQSMNFGSEDLSPDYMSSNLMYSNMIENGLPKSNTNNNGGGFLLELPNQGHDKRSSYISFNTDRYSQGSNSKYQVGDGAKLNQNLLENFQLNNQNPSHQQFDFIEGDPQQYLNYSIEPPQYAFQKQEKQYKNVPDSWNVVYFFMILFGIGSLLPFSATTTAIEYFNKNNKFPLQRRIFVCFMGSAILCVSLPIIVYFLPDYLAWILTVIIMVFLGIFMAVLSSSIAGLAGILPPRYMSAYMLGISLNAVGPLIIRVITLASFGLLDEVKYFFGALVFFGSTALYLVICAFGILLVIKQNVIIFNLVQTLKDIQDQDEDYDDMHVNRLIDANNTYEFNEAVYQCVQSQNKMTSLRDVWGTFKQIWIESLILFLVYVNTMVCYPGLILQTTLSFTPDESWFQVTILSIFSLSDIFGRFFTKYIGPKPKKSIILLVSLIRIITVYTSLMIGFNEEPKFIFDSDWFKILNTVFLGFGNGFLGTILMMIGPYKVSNQESERAGQIMAFYMTLGRGLGSMASGVGLYQTFKEIQETIRKNYHDMGFFKL